MIVRRKSELMSSGLESKPLPKVTVLGYQARRGIESMSCKSEIGWLE